MLLFDFGKTLQDLEVFLCISAEDYASRDINTSIENIKMKIQRQYAIDINGLNASHVATDSVLYDGMLYHYSQLCAFSHQFRYLDDVPINLNDVNYFGLTRDSFLGLAKMLQRENRYTQVSVSMEQLKAAIQTIPMCIEKKLLMLLYILYTLKFYQVCAVIAEILYLGGVKL